MARSREFFIEFYVECMLGGLLDDALELRKEVINGPNMLNFGELIGRYKAMKIFLDQAKKHGIKDKLPPRLRDLNPEELLNIFPRNEDFKPK